MKKIVLVCCASLLAVGLGGCGKKEIHNQTKHVKSEKIKKSSSSKKASSSSKSSSSAAISSSSQTNTSQVSSITASVQSTQQTSTVQTQQNNNQQNASADNLQDFIAKYGVSPAEYKVQHDGMTPQQALDATPDNMKTTGELQLQHSMENNQ